MRFISTALQRSFRGTFVYKIGFAFGLLTTLLLPTKGHSSNLLDALAELIWGDKPMAFNTLADLSNNGDAFAKYYYATFFEEGILIEQDLDKAFDLYSDASEGGVAKATLQIARLLFQQAEHELSKPSDARSCPLIVKTLEQAARLGSIRAHYELAFLSAEGICVASNQTLTEKWLSISDRVRPTTEALENWEYYKDLDRFANRAEQGDSAAQFLMAMELYARALDDPPGSHTKDQFIKWLMKSSEQGYPLAQVHLAHEYVKGDIVDKDIEAAFELYNLAAAQGHPVGIGTLGYMYLSDVYFNKDLTKATQYLTSAAEKSPYSARDLASLYRTGRLEDSDGDNAKKWYRVAQERRVEDASFWLGWVLDSKAVSTEDSIEATAQYVYSLNQPLGDLVDKIILRLVLGSRFFEGIGTEKQSSRAMEFLEDVKKQHYSLYSLERLVKQEDPNAYFYLGWWNLVGAKVVGIERNEKLGVNYLLKSAQQGHFSGSNVLENLLVGGDDTLWSYDKVVEWLHDRADQGSLPSQLALGREYERGKRFPQNDLEAATWFQRAANKGNAEAQFRLGMKYKEGAGVSRNLVLAYMWFNLAEAGGIDGAERQKRALTAKMSTSEVNEAQSMASRFTPRSN